MCQHVFSYPEDKLENYNPDGETITGICKCGAKKKAYGMRYLLPIYDELSDNPYNKNYKVYVDEKVI